LLPHIEKWGFDDILMMKPDQQFSHAKTWVELKKTFSGKSRFSAGKVVCFWLGPRSQFPKSLVFAAK
jgi:hypothetical protein